MDTGNAPCSGSSIRLIGTDARGRVPSGLLLAIVERCLDARFHPELLHHARHVMLDRLFGEIKPLCNIARCAALGDELQERPSLAPVRPPS